MKRFISIFLVSLLAFTYSSNVQAQFFFGPGSSVEDAGRAGRGDGLCIRAMGYMSNCDYANAYNCYYEAFSECNSAQGALGLGIIYEYGLGRKINRDKAWYYYRWARDHGNYEAKGFIDRINKNGFVTSQQAEKIKANMKAKAQMSNAGGGYYSVPNYNSGSSGSSSRSYARTCPACGGTGACKACSGNGYWRDHDNKVYQCLSCHGGRCGVCFGKGKIEP